MSSHNTFYYKKTYTKDCSDTEGYKNQTNFVAQKMAASEVFSAQCINRTLTFKINFLTQQTKLNYLGRQN